jgi:hypothetical protein
VEAKKVTSSWPERGYPVEDAKAIAAQGLAMVKEEFGTLPSSLAPGGFVLIELIRHPERQKNINFPKNLIKKLKLIPIEILEGTVTVRSSFNHQNYGNEPQLTTRILATAQRRGLKSSETVLTNLRPESREGAELACLEAIRPFKASVPSLPRSRLTMVGEDSLAQFLASLYPIPGERLRLEKGFTSLAKKLGFGPLSELGQGRAIRFPGKAKAHLLEIRLLGPVLNVFELVKFTLLESINYIK